MSVRDQAFIIREKELAERLSLSINELEEIICQIELQDKERKRKILKEGKDFIFINKIYKDRLFSRFGAYAIAGYVDKHSNKNLIAKIRDFITQRQKRIRQGFIRQSIHENIYPIRRIGGKNCITKQSTVLILETSFRRLDQAFKELKLSEKPLEIGKDYIEVDGVKYYTFSGFEAISRRMGRSLSQKYRADWCSDVAEVMEKEKKVIIKYLNDDDKRVKQAMNWVKNSRDKKQCQITLEKPSKQNPFDLAVHHIFDRKNYPHLEASPDNLITIKAEIHKEYHAWIRATQQECTISTLIVFVAHLYDDSEGVFLRLSEFKSRLGSPKPSVPKIQHLLADAATEF